MGIDNKNSNYLLNKTINENKILKNILENSTEVIWYLSYPELKINFLNSEQTKKLYGIDPQEFYNDPTLWNKCIHPEDQKKVITESEKLIRGDIELMNIEYRIVKPDNTMVWVKSRTSRVLDDSGNIIALNGKIFDISLEKNESLNLKKINQYYDYILESAGLGAWDWWLISNKVHLDSRWCEMLGLDYNTTPQELKTWDSLIHPDDKDEVYKNIKDYLDGKTEIYESIHRLKHKNGNWIWILDRGKISEWDQNKTPIRFTGTHYDISTHKNEEDLYKSVQENGKIGAWEIDLITQKNKWSEQTNKIHHLPVNAETNLKNAINFYAPHEREKISKYVNKCIQGIAYQDVFEFYDNIGTHKWVKAMGEPVFNALGEVIKIRGTFQDITLEKKAELELIEKSNSLNSLILSLDDIIFEVDQEENFLNVWVEDESKLFLPKDQFINKKIKDILPEQTYILFHENIKASILEKKKKSFNYQNPFIENKELSPWYNCKITPQFNFSKNIKLTIIITDITQEMNQKIALDKNTKELNEFFTISNELLCIASLEGFFIKINPAFSDVLGYSIDELIGKPFIDFIHPDDIEKTLNEINKLNQGIKTLKFINKYKCKNGNYKILSWMSSPDQKAGYMYATARDITEINQKEELLNEAQKVAKIGSWSYNLSTNLISWSEQMYNMFPEDIKNGPPSFERHFSTIHPDDQKIWKSHVDKCAETGQPYRFRFRSLMLDGPLWMEAIGHCKKDPSNKIYELSGTCQDISELVQYEENLKMERAKSMQNAKLASLGELSAGIAHEINNPLAIISGNLQILEKFIDNPEKFKLKIQSLIKSTDRITKIIYGLKKFSRSSEKSVRNYELLKNILEESILLIDSKLKKHSIEIKTNINTEGKILCNIVEIEQVIINLLNNSIDAIKTLNEKWIALHLFENETAIIFQIMDSGKMIDMATEQRIFEPFFTTKPIGEGTGLGLSISKGILDDHQATIFLNRKYPNTCFEISL